MPGPSSRSLNDDDTAYSEDESDFSDNASIISIGGLRAHREFHLDAEDGQKPVYEAWQFRLPADNNDSSTTTTSWKVLGATVASKVSTKTTPSKFYVSKPINTPVDADQSELASMHLRAIEQFQAAHRRGWASRMLRRQSKTYEKDLDERCSKLPPIIQAVMSNFLYQRDTYSSTKYRARKWTVAVMEEQSFRFAKTEREPLEKKTRFWKKANPPPPETVTYLFVLRGVETKTCEDPRGFARSYQLGNPWLEVDREEARCRNLEARLRRAGERRKRRSTLSSSYGDWRSRSRSPSSASESSERSRSPPSYRRRRDYSPVSEAGEAEARRYIRESRLRVPMPPAPPAPGPTFTPCWEFPPSGSGHRDDYGSRMPPPPPVYPPPRFDDCFAPPAAFEFDSAPVRESFPPPSPPPLQPATRPIVTVNTSHCFRATTPFYGNRDNDTTSFYGNRDNDTIPLYDSRDDGRPYTASTAPRPRAACEGCRATADCDHFNKPTCDRPLRVQRVNGSSQYSHPPCFICMAKGSTAPFAASGSHLAPSEAGNAPTVSRPASVQPAGSPSVWPPPYSPGTRWCGNFFDERDAATDIEIESDDDDDDDDEEATAVADSPRPKLEE